MTASRAVMFSLSTLALAAAVAWEAPGGPDSPRAKLAVWLREHGYPNAAIVVAPPDPTTLPGLPAGSPFPP